MTEAPQPDKLKAFEKQKKRLRPLVIAGIVYAVLASAASIYFRLNKNLSELLIFGPVVLVGYLFRLKCPYCSQAIWGTRFEACPKCGGILTSKPQAAKEAPKPLEPFLLQRKTTELREKYRSGKKYARYGMVCMALTMASAVGLPFLMRPDILRKLGPGVRPQDLVWTLGLCAAGTIGFFIAGAIRMTPAFKCPACKKAFVQGKTAERQLKSVQFCPHCRMDLREYIRQVFGS